MRWLKLVLVACGIAAAVALAVMPTSVVYASTDSEVSIECGAPFEHAIGGTAPDEGSSISFGSAEGRSTCREQARTRVAMAGGVAVLTLVVGSALLRPRRPDATHASDPPG